MIQKMLSFTEQIPILGQFELTSRCNLRCNLCFTYGDENAIIYKERDAKEWISLAREAYEQGMIYLTLTGGEVFVRKDFRTIYEELSVMGLVIQINTNATLITPEIASWLGRRPPSSIAITIYGASADTYLKIYRDGSGYNRMLRGIELLREQGISLRIRTTVIRGNTQEFYELLRLTEQYGTTRLLQVLPEEKLEQREHPFECSKGNGQFSVTWEGMMVPCIFMKSPSTDPFAHGFRKAWEELVRLCSEIQSCEECNHCGYKNKCMSCPASRMMETDCYDKPIPYLCEYMKLKYLPLNL